MEGHEHHKQVLEPELALPLAGDGVRSLSWLLYCAGENVASSATVSQSLGRGYGRSAISKSRNIKLEGNIFVSLMCTPY